MTFRSFQNVDIANLEFIGMGYAGNHIERFELLFKYGGTALYVEFIEAMGARILNSTFISNLITAWCCSSRCAVFSRKQGRDRSKHIS